MFRVVLASIDPTEARVPCADHDRSKIGRIKISMISFGASFATTFEGIAAPQHEIKVHPGMAAMTCKGVMYLTVQ